MNVFRGPFCGVGCLVLAGCFYHPSATSDASKGDTGTEDTAVLTGTETQSPTETASATDSDGSSDTTSATCGDGVVDIDEGCDDGNDVDDDTCNNMCVTPGCGDGQQDGDEACDDGNMVDEDACTHLCKLNVCGDGFRGPDEGCDDGNMVDEDACSNNCLPTQCGDGVVAVNEECDDGDANADTAACTSTCKQAACGDGFTRAGVEQCDDGNAVDDDLCNNACELTNCGDGIVGPGEQCDLGVANSDSAACTSACKDAVCGDGLLLSGGEECDDANSDDTDECVSCMQAQCGDGFVQANVEECDSGEDCGIDCKFVLCGNGTIDGDEQCDDGTEEEADTCANNCTRQAYLVFVTNQKFRGDFGGLADADNLCNDAAVNEALPGAGKYMAWLGDDNTSVNDRLAHSTLRYIRTDNMVVADNWNDITDGTLDGPINRTENQLMIPNGIDCNSSDALVWTNTTPNGDNGPDSCFDWTKDGAGDDGGVGLATAIDSRWTAECTRTCNNTARLYCIEQP